MKQNQSVINVIVTDDPLAYYYGWDPILGMRNLVLVARPVTTGRCMQGIRYPTVRIVTR